jgi:predicted O-methyltransferase YrrM
MNSLAKEAIAKSSSNPVATSTQKGQDAAAIGKNSEFARSIHTLFARARPKKIVETGTYQGLGSTLTICEALYDNQLSTDQFFSIEVNPNFYSQAFENLKGQGFKPRLLRGLSVPRALLPSEADIQRETVDQVADRSVFIDHQPEKRVFYYQKETDFPNELDDLLGFVIRAMNGAPDFVMLDSAGHMGFVEFQYAISLIKRPCYFALDDVFHIKHCRSLAAIQADSRFKLLEVSREKFGFCIAHFNP